MKVIGYVSSEEYLALAEVSVVFEKDDEVVYHTKSLATGAVLASLDSGK